MKFKAYLEEKDISLAQASTELDVSTECVRLWAEEKRIPRPDQMKRIYNWSHGVVTPNDFYDLPDDEARANGLSHQMASYEGAAA